jgi:hypothetical protein
MKRVPLEIFFLLFNNDGFPSGIFGNLLSALFLGVKEKKTGIIKRKVPNNSYVVRTEVLEEDEEEDLGKPHFSLLLFIIVLLQFSYYLVYDA